LAESKSIPITVYSDLPYQAVALIKEIHSWHYTLPFVHRGH
jgi:hypothetical protein